MPKERPKPTPVKPVRKSPKESVRRPIKESVKKDTQSGPPKKPS